MEKESPVIKVIGVGESGRKAIAQLWGSGWDNVDFMTLDETPASELKGIFQDADMAIFLADAQNQKAAEAAECAKGMNVLAIVMVVGENVPKALVDASDTVMELRFDGCGDEHHAAAALAAGVWNVMEIMSDKALISIDFCDLKNLLSNAGVTAMTLGRGYGVNATLKALKNATDSMKKNSILSKATSVLMYITGSGDNIKVMDVGSASAYLCEKINPTAGIIWGVTEEESMDDRVDVTLIASRLAV
ncbi:MAG: hypothetical protein SPL45_02290 [Schwartzia succinivorans]|nr:hypothetical protein [Schwartzia succinivorans]